MQNITTNINIKYYRQSHSENKKKKQYNGQKKKGQKDKQWSTKNYTKHFQVVTSTQPIETLGSIVSLLTATLYQDQLRDKYYYAGAAGRLLHIKPRIWALTVRKRELDWRIQVSDSYPNIVCAYYLQYSEFISTSRDSFGRESSPPCTAHVGKF